MKNPIKTLSRLQGKKRYIFLGLLALELVSLPAAAQIVQRVSFTIPPIVTAVEIPTAEAGLSRFLVTSNAGFGVEATDFVGNVNTDVHKSGTLSGSNRFGDAAQLPGPKKTCAMASGFDSNIYVANQKTAANRGTPPEQAVIFEFRYDKSAHPKFVFKSGADATASIQPCLNSVS